MQGHPLLRMWASGICMACLKCCNPVAVQASGHVLVSPIINGQGEQGYFILDTGMCTACCSQLRQTHFNFQLCVMTFGCELRVLP